MVKKFIASLDYTFLFLLFSNLIVIAIAVIQNWQVDEVIWVYFGQNITIGLYHSIRVSLLHTGKNGKYEDSILILAIFFLIHYGGTHVGIYYSLRNYISAPKEEDLIWIMIGILMFALSHGYSFKIQLEEDKKKIPNGAGILFGPYVRIIPMSIVGFAIRSQLVYFLIFKSFVDIFSHLAKHNLDFDENKEPFKAISIKKRAGFTSSRIRTLRKR